MKQLKGRFDEIYKKVFLSFLLCGTLFIAMMFAFNFFDVEYYISVPVGVVTLLLFIYFSIIKSLRKESNQLVEELSESLGAVAQGIASIREDSIKQIEVSDEIAEINDVKDAYNNSINYLLSHVFEGNEPINEELAAKYLDRDNQVYELDEFKSIMNYALSHSEYCYYSAVAIVRIVGNIISNDDSEIFLTYIRDYFKGSLFGKYEKNEFLVFMPRISSAKMTYKKLVDFVGEYNSLKVHDVDQFSIISSHIGAALYPENEPDEIIDSAKKELEVADPVSFSKEEYSIVTKDYMRGFISESKKRRESFFFMCYLVSKINECSTDSELEDILKKTYDATGVVLGVSNCGVMMFNVDHSKLVPQYEYSLDKNTLRADIIGKVVNESYSEEYFKLFNSDGVLYCNDINNLSYELKNLMSAINVFSLYHYKIMYKGRCQGILYFHNEKRTRDFTIDERALLLFISSTLGNLINYIYLNQKREESSLILNSLLRRNHSYSYSIDQSNYMITFLSKSLIDRYPDIKLGNICYKALQNLEAPCDFCPLAAKQVDPSTLGKYKNLEGLHRCSILNYVIDSGNNEPVIIVEPTDVMVSVAREQDYNTTLKIKNKLSLINGLEYVLAHSDNKSGYVGFVQINDYSQIVTEKGRSVFDNLMTNLSQRLQSLGFENFLYIYSENIFALIFDDTNKSKAIDNIEKIFSAVTKPITIDSNEIMISINTALVAYPADLTKKETLDKFAKVTLEESVALGPNQLYIYGEKGGRSGDRKTNLIEIIDDAIKKEKFEIFLQPIYNIESGKMDSAEVLLRLFEKERGFIPPREFIPVAVENNRMFEIEQTIIKKVGDLYKQYAYGAFKNIGIHAISVNLSVESIKNPRFSSCISDICNKYHFPKKFLKFEINEGIFMANKETIKELSDELAPFGIAWSIDDFGTEFSEVDFMSNARLDEVKIDRTLFIDVENNNRSLITLAALVEVAKNQKLSVTAEGVETLNQLDLAKQLKLNRAQGYYFAKPMSVNDFIRFITLKK